MKHSILLLALTASSSACRATPPPPIVVSSLGKTLEDALVLARSSKTGALEVEASVAYGTVGKVSIPIAIPLEFGASTSSATKLKFVFTRADLEGVPVVEGALDAKGIDRRLFLYDPTTGVLTPID